MFIENGEDREDVVRIKRHIPNVRFNLAFAYWLINLWHPCALSQLWLHFMSCVMIAFLGSTRCGRGRIVAFQATCCVSLVLCVAFRARCWARCRKLLWMYRRDCPALCKTVAVLWSRVNVAWFRLQGLGPQGPSGDPNNGLGLSLQYWGPRGPRVFSGNAFPH